MFCLCFFSCLLFWVGLFSCTNNFSTCSRTGLANPKRSPRIYWNRKQKTIDKKAKQQLKQTKAAVVLCFVICFVVRFCFFLVTCLVCIVCTNHLMTSYLAHQQVLRIQKGHRIYYNMRQKQYIITQIHT